MKNYYTPENINKFFLALIDAKNALRQGMRKARNVSISKGNIKTGAVPSVSTLPFITCPGSCCKTCGKKCYAAKIALLRPSVLRAYARNTAIALEKPEIYWRAVDKALKMSRYFRFHVSGDIIDRHYFACMIGAAIRNPKCNMLAFTKQYDIVNEYLYTTGGILPDNLQIIFSAWPEIEFENPYNLPVAVMLEKGKEPDPAWITCGGNCFNCACYGCGCWTLQRGQVIFFREH